MADHPDVLDGPNTLIHLHSLHNISYFLRDKRVTYTAIVRDPIERFCSDIAHLHNALLNFSEVAREDFLARMPWNTELKALMIDDSASLDNLLEMAAKESFFRFFYYHFFTRSYARNPFQ
ncbi:MAG TPA: hypothetical protein VH107_18860 [Lacipirellulaceae bacterium]|nr:hypothetical protein [Lacipirellulaceae bacterium]